MHLEQILSELQKYGDKRAVSRFKKMGINTENYFGADIIKIKNLSSRIRKNHNLAENLKKSGIRDALLLSFMIDEPKKISRQEVRSIVKQTDYCDLADNFCAALLVNTDYVNEFIDEWKDSSREMTKRCAYYLVHELAKNDTKLSEDYFEEFLQRIEKEISYSKNWVKDAMLLALTSIGGKNDNLRTKAIEVANKVGKIDIQSKNDLHSVTDPLKFLLKKKSPKKSK